MALEIVKLYTTTLSQFFTLSDVAIAESASRKEGEELPIPAFVPLGTTVLTACFFAERLADEVVECSAELMGVDVGSEAANSLRGMLESLRWRMEEVIGVTWSRGK